MRQQMALVCRLQWLAGTGAIMLALAACAVGPDYQKPDAATQASFKEAKPTASTEPTPPAEQFAWWAVYRDPVLDGLEQQVAVSNQTLKASEAAYRQAQAIVKEARAGYYPQVGADGSAQRSQAGGSSASRASGRRSPPVTQYSISGTASWVPDLWGRVQRTVEADSASAQASAADLAATKLSLQGELAIDYLSLRVTDELKRLLDTEVEAFTRSLEITQNRYAVGTAARSDVASAQAQLEQTRSQALNLGIQRAQFEHAIAVLIGKPPADLSLPAIATVNRVPVIPTGVASTLLERRPDVAAAERRVAAANAEIGIAVAAYYPDVTLAASYGYAGPVLGSLLQAANSLWALGSQLAVTVFDAGARSAQVEAARAFHEEAVATYRQTVLAAFQQVEDQLVALRILEQQAVVQAGAVRAAREAEQLTLNQ